MSSRSTEDQERFERFDRLGRGIAAALNDSPGEEGAGWTHQARSSVYGDVSLHHPEGLVLSFEHKRYNDESRGRLTVTGRTPPEWSGRQVFEIGVSITRDPAAIAKDVRRRLLPNYCAAMREAIPEVADTHRRARARVAAMERLQAALPALKTYDWDSERSAGSFYEGAPVRPRAHASGTVRVNQGGTTVDLKMSGVPLHLAEQILALLNAGQQAVTGRIMPPAIAPADLELPPVERVIPGEVVAEQPAVLAPVTGLDLSASLLAATAERWPNPA